MPIVDQAAALARQLDVVWTLLLLMSRFTGLMLVFPGIGGGLSGLAIRAPAILVLSLTAMVTSARAVLPADWFVLAGQVGSEFLFGLLIGFIPYMIIAGVQLAGQFTTTAMGVGAGTLFDPTFGVQTSDLSRILGDISVILFLLIGGHHILVHAAAGLGGTIVPGTFAVSKDAVDLLIHNSANILRIGLMISAPVLVALLLANFALAMLSRAVPQMNIFIIAFPLTIGIGLILTVLALPEVMRFVDREFAQIDRSVAVAVESTTRRSGF